MKHANIVNISIKEPIRCVTKNDLDALALKLSLKPKD